MTQKAPVKPQFLVDRKKQHVLRQMEMEKISQENKILLDKIDTIQWRHVKNPRGKSLKSSSLCQIWENKYPFNTEKSTSKFKKQELKKIESENAVQEADLVSAEQDPVRQVAVLRGEAGEGLGAPGRVQRQHQPECQ